MQGQIVKDSRCKRNHAIRRKLHILADRILLRRDIQQSQGRTDQRIERSHQRNELHQEQPNTRSVTERSKSHRSPFGITFRATPHNCGYALRWILSTNSAVWKAWNSYSIPARFKPWPGEKSLAGSACRIVRCYLITLHFSNRYWNWDSISV